MIQILLELEDVNDLHLWMTFCQELSRTRGYSAAVFTQLADVEGELNGYFSYDRSLMMMMMMMMMMMDGYFCYRSLNYQQLVSPMKE